MVRTDGGGDVTTAPDDSPDNDNPAEVADEEALPSPYAEDEFDGVQDTEVE